MISWYQPAPIGPGFYAELVRSFVEYGHEIEVIAQACSGSAAYDQKILNVYGVKIHRLPTDPGSSVVLPNARQFKIVTNFIKCVLNRQKRMDALPDVFIFGHEYWVWYKAALEDYEIPFIVNLRGAPTRLVIQKKFTPQDTELFLSFLHASHYIVSVSKTFEKFLIDNGIPQTKVTTIDNGIDLSLFHPISTFQKESEVQRLNKKRQQLNIPITNKIIINISMHYHHKRVIDFVISGLIVLEQNKDITYVIVGEGPETKQILDLINTSRYADHFIYLGAQEHRQVPDLLKMSDLFVLCSDGEGFPRVVLEAFASGLLTLIPQTTQTIEFTDNDTRAMSYHLGDCCHLAKKTLDAIQLSHSTRQRMIIHALQFVRTSCSFDVQVFKYINLINRLIIVSG
ncbi:MAG: glycosyltransferase [Gammaproteobacteria bacterium]|nr:glycosyltransferase [Gammaproteobacteria bacterium]